MKEHLDEFDAMISSTLEPSEAKMLRAAKKNGLNVAAKLLAGDPGYSRLHHERLDVLFAFRHAGQTLTALNAAFDADAPTALPSFVSQPNAYVFIHLISERADRPCWSDLELKVEEATACPLLDRPIAEMGEDELDEYLNEVKLFFNMTGAVLDIHLHRMRQGLSRIVAASHSAERGSDHQEILVLAGQALRSAIDESSLLVNLSRRQLSESLVTSFVADDPIAARTVQSPCSGRMSLAARHLRRLMVTTEVDEIRGVPTTLSTYCVEQFGELIDIAVTPGATSSLGLEPPQFRAATESS